MVAGDPATGQRLVTGDPVNVAARLEQAAAPGEVLIGDPTFRLVRDAVEVEPVDALQLKEEERVAAFRLLSVTADVAGHERHLDSPMVGHAKELSLLEHALERAIGERTSHLFTLMEAAGVGKSRAVAGDSCRRRPPNHGPPRTVPASATGEEHRVLPAGRAGPSGGRQPC